jgi:hypothetical protein
VRSRSVTPFGLRQWAEGPRNGPPPGATLRNVSEEPLLSPALEQVRQLLFPDLPPAEGRARVANAVAGAADTDRWQRIEQIAADEPEMLQALIEELRATRDAQLDEAAQSDEDATAD